MDYGLWDHQHIVSTGRGTYGYYTVTPSGVSTKGTYTAIEDNLPQDSTGFYLYHGGDVFSGSKILADIGIGPHTSEQVIVNNIPIASDINIGSMVYFPLFVKKGSKVGIRTSGSGSFSFSLSFVRQGINYVHPVFSQTATYGAVTTGSSGTTITPSGVAYTPSAWVELTSSVTMDHQAFILFAHKNAAAVSAASLGFDVAQGPSGSERIVIADLYIPQGTVSASRVQHHPWATFIPAPLKAGQALSVRMTSDLAAPGVSHVVIVGLTI